MTAQTATPSGEVTFLFTDVEGSTGLWAENVDAMGASLRMHDQILRSVIEGRSGYVFSTAGDSFAAAFGAVADAVGAARTMQERLAAADWPGPALRVRMGLHSGSAEERDGDYFGPDVNLAARIESAAHGGQVLMSEDAQGVVEGEHHRLGSFSLRGVSEPVVLYQLGDGSFPAPRVPSPALAMLPSASTELVGREDDVRTTRALLVTNRLVTLTGAGGSGKTRLALEVAERELPDRVDGAYFADLASISDGRDLPGAVAGALRLTLESGDPVGQIVRYLEPKDALLVLDNFEHIIDDCAELVEAIVSTHGGCRVLATSRELLDVGGEAPVQVGSLDSSDPQSPGVRLFDQRARSAEPGFHLTEDLAPAVQRLVKALDGMPLAIELAASRVGALSVTELLEGIDDRFRLLGGGRRGRRRGRTLEATMAWSYDLLDDIEQRCFRHCAVFVGPFDREALAVISGLDDMETVDLLESLVAKSLVTLTESDQTHRFRLLETVRAYGERQLDAAAELEPARERHLDLMIDRWGYRDPPVRPATLDAAPRELMDDRHNLIAALDWAVAGDRVSDAARLLIGSAALWNGSLPTADGLDRVDAIGRDLTDPDLQQRLKLIEVFLRLRLDDYSGLRDGAMELTTSDDPELVAFGHGYVAYHDRAHTDSGKHHLSASIEAVELTRERYGDAAADQAMESVRMVRAFGAVFAGDLPSAAGDLSVLVESGVGSGIRAVAHQLLAAIHLLDGNPDAALELLEACPQIDWFDTRAVLQTVALCQAGELDEAIRCIADFGAIARLSRNSREANEALVGLAAVLLATGDDDTAREYLEASVPPRMPWSMLVCQGLAMRLGIGPGISAALEQALSTRGDMSQLDATDVLVEALDQLPGNDARQGGQGHH